MGRSAPTSFIILDTQSAKNTETTENKSYDGDYTGGSFAGLVQSTIGVETIIAKQSDLKHGWITPQRRMFERAFSWLNKCRRLWRNRERYLQTSRIMVALSLIRILLKRY